jgi:hypothetical protein
MTLAIGFRLFRKPVRSFWVKYVSFTSGMGCGKNSAVIAVIIAQAARVV